MNVIIGDSLEELLRLSIKEILKNGNISNPRGLKTIEISPLTLILNYPRNRFIKLDTINYPLIAVKQIFFLLGKIDNLIFNFYENSACRDNTYSAAYIYSDLLFSGSQKAIYKIYQLLLTDICSRQAVLRISTVNKIQENYKPITISCQFIYRNGRLNLITYMRSNELWKGLATDFHYIIFLQELLASWLNVEIGTYTHIIGSAHIYESNISNVEDYLSSEQNRSINTSLFFKSNFEDTLSEARKFIKLERDIRLKNIQNKSCFKNPYLNWCIQLVNNQAQKNCNSNYSQNQ
jgi:thymidylate synthase